MPHPRFFYLSVILLGIGSASLFPTKAWADNPIIQTLYTADPAPMVYEGTLYLYTTHDEDVTVGDFFTMNDWRVYSSEDVVNWTDHGSPLSYHDFAWADGSAWAGQVIPRNGKFYFYVPVVRDNGSNAIGVATSDSPLGPFQDALGAPLVTSDCGDIDPTVFIDNDGQAYLYWGNPNLCYVKMNEDMLSYQGGVQRVPLDTTGFGARSDSDRATSYEEGPWFYRRDDRFYLVYPGGPLPEHIAYSTASGPTGPWTYQGTLMPAEGGSFTNHPGVVDFGGKSLFFYHNAALPGGGGFKRSVCVEEFAYGADGSIPQLHMTSEGASAVASLNPFVQVEAETIAWQAGIETEVCDEGGMNVTAIDAGDFIEVKEVEFGEGASSFTVRVAASSDGGVLELRLDDRTGPSIAKCAISKTGGDRIWAAQSCVVDGAIGKHNLFLEFTAGGYKFNWWRFDGPGATPAAGRGGAGGGAAGSDGSAGANPRGAAGAGGIPVSGGHDNAEAGAAAIDSSGATSPGSASLPPLNSTAPTTPPASNTGAAPSTGSGTTPAVGGSASTAQGPNATPSESTVSNPAVTSPSAATVTTSASGAGSLEAPAVTNNTTSDSHGCGCRVVGERSSPRASFAATVLALVLFTRRRRVRTSVSLFVRR